MQVTPHLGACPICPLHGSELCEPKRVGKILDHFGIERPSRNFRAGLELFAQDEASLSYFILTGGWVALSTTLEDGARQILDFVLPGGLLGIQPNLEGVGHYSAVCLTDTTVMTLPRAKLDAAMADDNRLMDHVLHIAACQTARAYDHIQNISKRSARGRVAHLLVELFFRIRHRFPAMPGETVELPLTLTHIGDALGLTNVHVSRTLAELHTSRILQLSRRLLVVQDPDSLLELAGYGPVSSPENTSNFRMLQKKLINLNPS